MLKPANSVIFAPRLICFWVNGVLFITCFKVCKFRRKNRLCEIRFSSASACQLSCGIKCFAEKKSLMQKHEALIFPTSTWKIFLICALQNCTHGSVRCMLQPGFLIFHPAFQSFARSYLSHDSTNLLSWHFLFLFPP